MSNDTQASPRPVAQTQRKRWLAIVVGAFAAIGFAYGAYWAIDLRYVQTTDDAYVNGNVVQITPQLSANDIFYASALLFLLLIAVIWLARPAKAGDAAAAAAGAH